MRWLIHNLHLKLLSFALAVLAWAWMVGEQDLTATVQVSLQYRRIPPDLEISSDLPERVTLEIAGPSGKLTLFGQEHPPVVLDLGGVASPGERTLNIDNSNVRLPTGVRLLRAIPSQVRLLFETRAVREIPVKLRYAGPPPTGYRIVRAELRPEVLRVVGPQSRVTPLDSAETDPVDLTGVFDSKEFRVNAFVEDERVRFESSPLVVVKVFLERSGQPEVK